jgi:Tetracyclin repressor-like, C-terminal domain
VRRQRGVSLLHRRCRLGQREARRPHRAVVQGGLVAERAVPTVGPALAAPPIGPVYRALIAEAQADETLRATLHERFLRTVEERTLARIVLAQQAGELVAGVDPTFPAEVLCATLYYRHLLSTRVADEAAVDALLDMFMAAYGR